MSDDGEGDEAGAVEVSVGERRVRVDVDFHSALAGNIRPGDPVDLLYMTNTTISPIQSVAYGLDFRQTVREAPSPRRYVGFDPLCWNGESSAPENDLSQDDQAPDLTPED